MGAERGGWRQAGALTWLLAAFCGWAVLLWLAALLGLGGRLPALPASDPGALPAVAAPVPARIGALAQYAEAAQRPLFSADRRPHAFVASVGGDEDGSGDGGALDFQLTGVLISPQVRLAILQPAAGGESLRVREGHAPDGAPGWRLLEVQPRRAIFEGSGGQITLELRRYGGADGTAAAPRSPAMVENAAAGAAAAAAEDAARAADAAAPPTLDETRRIEDIRRRIEARRAQLRGTKEAEKPGRLRPLSGPNK